ncbi:hypothetical protein R1sor_004144 [Riccia sorocarpa]|uniref:Uncharacterized protein n=1 Tax=Riccia sorocarpa TaxID=122646 RepID=A0ABD3H6G7_9MARC
MSVFSITALDRLIESDRRSSAKQVSPSMEKQGHPTQAERRPLYAAAYPYPSVPLSARPRSPSPTDFSPSPYVVNHKRRVPNGFDSKQALQQNGFHVSEKIPGSRPTESQDLVSRTGKENVSVDSRSLNALEGKQAHGHGSLTRELESKNSGVGKEDHLEVKKKSFDDSFRHFRFSGIEEKLKGRRAGGEQRDMNSGADNTRGKQKLEERLELQTSVKERTKIGSGSASTSTRSPHAPPSDSSSMTAEEWFDAPDAPLSEDSSDDEAHRNTSIKSVPSSRGDPDPDIASHLAEEIKRRIRAEEALIALQQQRDGMLQLLSSAGISVSPSDPSKLGEHGLEIGISQFEAEKLAVARTVAVAVARGAMKAEAEAELQSVLAEKSKEIARLRDKLQYYETLNHEMSQRNQEAIEIARQTRRRRQRRQRFAVLGVSAAICVGVSAAVVYHYVSWEQIRSLTGSASSSGDQLKSESGEKTRFQVGLRRMVERARAVLQSVPCLNLNELPAAEDPGEMQAGVLKGCSQTEAGRSAAWAKLFTVSGGEFVQGEAGAHECLRLDIWNGGLSTALIRICQEATLRSLLYGSGTTKRSSPGRGASLEYAHAMNLTTGV